MQGKHKEDGPAEQQRSSDKMGTPQTHAQFPALVQEKNAVKTESVEQREKNQDGGTNTQCRYRFVFVRYLRQELRNACQDVFPCRRITVLQHELIAARFWM